MTDPEDLPRFERIRHPARIERPKRVMRASNLRHSPLACEHKHGFASKRLAWRSVNARGRVDGSRVYHCDACGKWHVTLWTGEQHALRGRGVRKSQKNI